MKTSIVRQTWVAALCSFSLLTLSSAVKAADAPVQEFSAEYSVNYNGASFGTTAQQLLKRKGDKVWTFNSTVDGPLVGVEEQADFTWQGCVTRPVQYTFDRSGIGPSKTVNILFDWDKNLAHYKTKKESGDYSLQPGVMDKLSLQLAVRCQLIQGKTDLNFISADEDGLNATPFVVEGDETVHTELGDLKTVKIKRVRPNSNRETYVWLAPSHDYLMVKSLQIEKQKDRIELNILSFSNTDGTR
ncbi:MAG TPA: DUF3108 domain-containing protein [Pseudomonadales bacterium]|nr:DUF3108 domain-containing protein [Pseudomonadales bacterium]